MQSNTLTQIRHLNQEERLLARQTAAQVILQAVGVRPIRQHFNHHTSSKYPPQVIWFLTLLTLLALAAAFSTSAIRLYHIGSQTFGHTIPDLFSMAVAGISIVILAESAQIVFSLALAVYDTSKLGKRLLYFSMGMATIIALVGNIQLALPGQWLNPFACIEAIFPSFMVLSLAFVLKEQLLQFIRQRHANEQAYQYALEAWTVATANPEKHPEWEQYYANALRDSIIEANKRKKSINFSELSSSDWIYLVRNAMNSDKWFLLPDNEVQQHTTASENLAEIQAVLPELISNENLATLPDLEQEVEVSTPPYPLAKSTKNGHRHD